MDVRSPIIPHAKTAELVQPAQRPLHHPAMNTEPAVMRRAAYLHHTG